MFCPQCATPNGDDIKFCRSCGRELEAVALILSGKSPKPSKKDKNKSEPKSEKDWLEKQIEGVSGVTRGLIFDRLVAHRHRHDTVDPQLI